MMSLHPTYERKPNAPRRPAERERDRERIATLLTKGHTYAEIASETGLSIPTIASDVKAVKALWRERSSDQMQNLLAVETQKLDAIERQQWIELSRLVDPRDKIAALDVIGKTVGRRAKLLGLEALADVEAAKRKAKAEVMEYARDYASRINEILLTHVSPAVLALVADDLKNLTDSTEAIDSSEAIEPQTDPLELEYDNEAD